MSDVGRWQEAIAALPDKQFFNIMRLYIGEIKTPYNKQRLIEQLASFIRREENVKSIITYLDSFDLELLTAITLISKVTQETLFNFFSGTYSITDIYKGLLNLTERLLIYSVQDKDSKKEYLYVNPFLEEPLKPYINTNLLFPENVITTHSSEDVFILTPNILISFISYLKVKGISCKADGNIKKNDMKNLSDIFHGKEKFIQLLMQAFINLGLVIEKGTSYTIKEDKLTSFSLLSEAQQYALLTAASVSRFSREGLKKEAILILDCLSSIPDFGFTRKEIIRLAFLVGSYTEDGNAMAKKSRFSALMEAAKQEESKNDNDPQQNADLLDFMLDSCIEFGLLEKKGVSDKGEEIYTKGNLILPPDIYKVPEASLPKVVNIDSIYMITLMPGLPLSRLIPLTSFMMIKKCGVVAEFEINRNSASRGFDDGWTPESIVNELKNHTYYDIPQSLKINIEEWFTTYSSAVLYKGYVLKVDENNISFIENNPRINKYISEKLADGIFLLNIPLDSDVSNFLKDTGLNYIGKVRTIKPEAEVTTFPLLREGHKLNILDENGRSKDIIIPSIQEAANKIKSIKAKLETLDLDKNLVENLNYRISNRVILNEEQLSIVSIRPEVLEADGMDYIGKVHLIEAAIQDDDKLEITIPDETKKDSWITITGRANSLNKNEDNDAIVSFTPTFSDVHQFIIVSRITHIRRLRF